MLFNTPVFFAFLAVVYGLYRVLPHRGQNLMLLGASYVFYGWWDVRFLFLIALSTAVDYCMGLIVGRGTVHESERKNIALYLLLAALVFAGIYWPAIQNSAWVDAGWFQWKLFVVVGLGAAILVAVGNFVINWLESLDDARRQHAGTVISVVTNLTILGVFKYFNFFIGSAEVLASELGLNADLLRLDIVLPVGISFYTFQTLSYTIDVHRKKIKATESFGDFALFVAYFPQLVAGPIERASRLLPAISNKRTITFADTTQGLHLIALGLFKKVAIADGLAVTVDSIFGSQGAVSGLDVLIGTLAFTFQIYADFSGYSDIARGTSRLFGIQLMLNFRTPYFSTDPQDFWKRWHISLSSWLRDYLYISLGGNRGGVSKTYRNLMLTMILGGLWHGAAWNFVLWGIYQGALLCVHRIWSLGYQSGKFLSGFRGQLNGFVSAMIFLPLVAYGWLLFRAESWGQIIGFTTSLLTWREGGLGGELPRLSAIVGLPILLFHDALEFFYRNDEAFIHRRPKVLRGMLYAGFIFCIMLGLSNEGAQFIYFAF